MPARAVGIDFHVVAGRIGGKESVGGAQFQLLLAHDLLEQRLRVREQLGGFLAVLLVLEDLRINPAQFPGVEKWRPVDERHHFFQRHAKRSRVTVR